MVRRLCFTYIPEKLNLCDNPVDNPYGINQDLKAGFTGYTAALQVKMEKKVLTLAFLRPASDDPIMNRLTAAVSKHPLCHVKLVFSPDREPMGFSIQYGENLSLRPTRLSNPGYQVISLGVQAHTYDSIMNFCQEACTKNLSFDNLGMYFAVAHPGGCANFSSSTLGATFCSKIVCEALQAGGVEEVEGICPSACTPSLLYDAFTESPLRLMCPIRMPSTLKISDGKDASKWSERLV